MRKITPIVVPTSGSDGAATGSGVTTKPISGRVVAVHIGYSAQQANTADVTVTATNPDLVILARSDSATDGWFFPHTAAHVAADASVISGGAVAGIPVDGYITVAVADADDGESVTVTLLVADE